MVSRGDIEQKTDQFFKHYTGVSKAVWPSSLHRYFALGKGRRRFMLLRRLLSLYRRHFDYPFDAMQVFSKRLFATCSCTVHVVVVVVASDIIEFVHALSPANPTPSDYDLYHNYTDCSMSGIQ